MIDQNVLPGLIKQFHYYKKLGDQTLSEMKEKELIWQYNDESNSLAILINHLSGNMLSRFTGFLNEDGEKTWRNRDAEFASGPVTRDELLKRWNTGWKCLFDQLDAMEESDLGTIVYIRNVGHTALEAILRQLAHYAYHVGQMVFIGKMLRDGEWKSLSIPKGESGQFNQHYFDQPKSIKHFTDDFLRDRE